MSTRALISLYGKHLFVAKDGYPSMIIPLILDAEKRCFASNGLAPQLLDAIVSGADVFLNGVITPCNPEDVENIDYAYRLFHKDGYLCAEMTDFSNGRKVSKTLEAYVMIFGDDFTPLVNEAA